MNSAPSRTLKETLLAHKWVAIGVTLVLGFLAGLGLYYLGNLPPNRATVSQLIRGLQKQESPLHVVWQEVWPLMPDFITQWIPSLEPVPVLNTRIQAANLLGHRGAAAAPAVPFLVKGLEDPSPTVRAAAVDALRMLGPVAKNASPALLRTFNDPGNDSTVAFPELRVSAAAALARVSPEEPAVREALLQAARSHPNLDFRARLMEQLGTIPNPPPAVLTMACSWLESTNPPIRLAAIKALGTMGSAAAAAVPALTNLFVKIEAEKKALADAPQPRPVLRWVAGGPSGAMQPPYPNSNALARFGLAPRAGQGRVPASNTVVAAWQVDPAPPGDESLPEPGIASSTASTFVGIQLPSYDVFEAREAQLVIIDSLGKIGPAARGALPLLQREIDVPLNAFTYEAAFARWQIDRRTRAFLSLLSEGIKDASLPRRVSIMEYLCRIGPEAVPNLIAALDSPDTNIRFAAAVGLGGVGSGASSAIPKLESMLSRDPKFGVRSAAEAALKKIAPDRAHLWKAQLAIDFNARPTP